ncbi:MAG: serine/threonine-protein kinase [Pseudanabaenaceae cyanobacterium bins.39]|nr:serine/threonine-protein kinase [Pseudanabaenaceae cyanobacterium bins.39]
MAEMHQIGEIVRSRYQIMGILGEGGMGITYAATDLLTDDQVALKALSFRRITDWKILELFEREARVLSQLDHPAIAKYLDYFQVDSADDRDFYIVQEQVQGCSLAQAIAAGWHGSEADIIAIAEQVLTVLIYLHELKPPVIHRDIKPQNLIRQPDGKIMLVDFGAVQDTYRHTQVGGSTVVGTYGYMPPEQFRGKAVPATDLYALGATLLFLLTGRSPAELPEVKLKISFRNAVSISDHFANWLDRILEPALEDRFISARDALNALQQTPVPSSTVSITDAQISQLLNSVNPNRNLSLADLDRDYHFPQPLGSRIFLSKNQELLKVIIPPAGWRSQGIGLLGFAIFWNGFLILWTSLALRAGLFALFSIPFWVIGIGMAYAALAAVFGRVDLVIGDRSFSIDWDVIGIKRHIQGRTKDLRLVEINNAYEVNRRTITQLILHQGIYSHKFGDGLTDAEKEWLTQEINEFLVLWRSRHKSSS